MESKIKAVNEYITMRKTRAARHKGRMQTLKELEPMSVQMIEEGTREDAAAIRSLAAILRNDYGVRISITYYEGKIYAIRYE